MMNPDDTPFWIRLANLGLLALADGDGGDGGSDDDAGDDDDADGDEDGTDDGQDQGSDDGEDQLGDAGKQAIDRMKTRLKRERERRKAAEQKLAQRDDDDAAAKAESEATKKANRKIIRAELKQAAADRLTDPSDALDLIDIDEIGVEVDDDGEVDDPELLTAALDDLLERKPHLAKKGSGKPKPDPSQGGRGGGRGKKQSGAESLADWIDNNL